MWLLIKAAVCLAWLLQLVVRLQGPYGSIEKLHLRKWCLLVGTRCSFCSRWRTLKLTSESRFIDVRAVNTHMASSVNSLSLLNPITIMTYNPFGCFQASQYKRLPPSATEEFFSPASNQPIICSKAKRLAWQLSHVPSSLHLQWQWLCGKDVKCFFRYTSSFVINLLFLWEKENDLARLDEKNECSHSGKSTFFFGRRCASVFRGHTHTTQFPVDTLH